MLPLGHCFFLVDFPIGFRDLSRPLSVPLRAIEITMYPDACDVPSRVLCAPCGLIDVGRLFRHSFPYCTMMMCESVTTLKKSVMLVAWEVSVSLKLLTLVAILQSLQDRAKTHLNTPALCNEP